MFLKITIGEMITNRAYLSPEKVGIISKGKSYTYRQLNQKVNQLANYFIDVGVEAGDRIALLCKNNEEFIISFFAAAKIDAITVPLNWRLSKNELAYIVGNCEPTMLIYDVDFRNTVSELQVQFPSILSLIVGEEGLENSFFTALAKGDVKEPISETNNNHTILMMYTSGTTGKPKGAMISHTNLFAASIGMSHVVDWWEGDRFLSVAPFFHIGGFAPIITNIHKGCTSILMEDFHPQKAWEVIQTEKITTMMSVPAMLAFMLNTLDPKQVDYSSLRNITCGASPVPKQLIDAYDELGISVQQVYGITEYTGAVSFWKKAMDQTKGDSMGKVVFHGKVKVVDTTTKEDLPMGEVGEIFCQGPQVFNGYWNNEEKTVEAFHDGWYCSGDIGRIDEEGFLYVIDRLKDMIISGGENIYSAELEAVFHAHPSVAEVAVIGIPDEKWGEVPKAFLVLKPGSEVSEESLIDYCKENLASFKVVREVEILEALPRNAVGKILKTQLR